MIMPTVVSVSIRNRHVIFIFVLLVFQRQSKICSCPYSPLLGCFLLPVCLWLSHSFCIYYQSVLHTEVFALLERDL